MLKFLLHDHLLRNTVSYPGTVESSLRYCPVVYRVTVCERKYKLGSVTGPQQLAVCPGSHRPLDMLRTSLILSLCGLLSQFSSSCGLDSLGFNFLLGQEIFLVSKILPTFRGALPTTCSVGTAGFPRKYSS